MRRISILIVTSVVAVVAAALFVPSALALAIDESPPPAGQVGVPYFFQFNMEAGSGSNGMTWRISSGSLPPGLNLSYEGERWARVTGTPTKAGVYTFYLEAIDIPGPWVCCTERQFSITIKDKLIVTTQTPLPDAAINQAYGPVQLNATGGTVNSWSLASGTLPTGITLSSSGQIAGTPTQSGSFTFTVKANGSSGSDTKQLTLFVAAPLVLGGPNAVPPKSEPVPLNAKVLSPFSWGIGATGGRTPYTYSSTPLPAGLVLDPVTGLLTGTPTLAGVTKVTFTVKDGTGATDTLLVTLNVKALLAFAQGTPKPATVGKRFSWKIPVTGASKTRIYLASGQFPPGLDLDETTGVLSGTPVTAGSFKLKVWVLGDAGTQISKVYTVKVKA